MKKLKICCFVILFTILLSTFAPQTAFASLPRQNTTLLGTVLSEQPTPSETPQPDNTTPVTPTPDTPSTGTTTPE